MSTISLDCALCTMQFNMVKEWLQHLLTQEHQTRARDSCRYWFKDDDIKDRVLVVLSPYVRRAGILEHFSKEETPVVDFVSFRHNSTVGLLQFKTREEVDEHFANCPQIMVDCQPVRLKRMNEYYQFEWEELIPRPMSNHPTFYCIQDESDFPPIAINPAQSTTSKLSEQFVTVMKEVDSSSEYHIAEKIKNKLELLCSIKFTGDDSTWKVAFFRHWHLGNKNNGKNDFLFFLEIRNKYCSRSQSMSLQENFNVDDLLTTQEARTTFKNLEKVEKADETESSVDAKKVAKLFKFTLNEETIQIYLSSDLSLAPEVYTCNLLRCMCRFDPHVTPLIYLVNYWARVNNIVLGKVSETDTSDGYLSPDPALLEWLVMFFCCVKGMTPTPRYFKECPHNRIMCHGVDISYSGSNRVLMSWTDFLKKFRPKKTPFPSNVNTEAQFVLNVCRFAKEFFEFCAKFCLEPCILNLRDGQVITEQDFCRQLDGEEATWATKKLTSEEIEIVKTKMETESPLTILHPLVDLHGFSFDREKFVQETSKIMKYTAEKLETFCDQWNGLEEKEFMTLQAALVCKKIDEGY